MRKPATVMLSALVILGSIVPQASAVTSSAHDGEFFYLCEFSHRSRNDPILYPRKPRAGTRSEFYGNETTDAFSTAKSLANGKTTCRVLDDKSAYWFATLLRRGKVVKPYKVHIYYRNKVAATPQVFPFGLKYLAGNPAATSRQRGWQKRYFWQCGDTVASTHYPTPPDCPNDVLTLMIRFPQCWDGVRKDSKNHHAHVVYPRKGKCPAKYPVLVPQLQVHVQYDIHDGRSGAPLRLDSGSIFGIHAEFFNAWGKARLQSLIDGCIEAGISCHPNDLK